MIVLVNLSDFDLICIYPVGEFVLFRLTWFGLYQIVTMTITIKVRNLFQKNFKNITS